MLGTSSVTTATQAVAQHTNASATGLIKLVAISTGNASATGLIILVASMTGTCEAALSVLTSAMGTTCVGVFLTLIDICTVQPWLHPYTPYTDKTVASDTAACCSSSKASTLQAQHTAELHRRGGLVGSGITRHSRRALVGIDGTCTYGAGCVPLVWIRSSSEISETWANEDTLSMASLA